jgi:phage-related minor tail protein
VQKAYLLKRYREEVPPDSIFYAKSRSILALPEKLAQSAEVLADIDATIAHIFRFGNDEPSSVTIRREMQGTKDQLAQAIRDHALGEIDELRQAYVQIAEEFLTQLVELGGGYSAEEARRERASEEIILKAGRKSAGFKAISVNLLSSLLARATPTFWGKLRSCHLPFLLAP